MIKGLQGITGITVTHGNTSVPYINQTSNNPIQGMIRVYGSDMQVFDGATWLNMNAGYATVSLDQDILDIVQWARKKRDEEQNILAAAEKHPAIRIAMDNFAKAKQQLDVTIILSKEHNDTTTS